MFLLLPGVIIYSTAMPLASFRITGNAALGRWVILSAFYGTLALACLEVARITLSFLRSETVSGVQIGGLDPYTETSIAAILLFSVVIPFIIGLLLKSWLHRGGTPRRVALFLMGWENLNSQTPSELVPTPWDKVFSQGKKLWVIATFPDGSRIGGWYGLDSFATSYPEAQQIYLRHTYKLDEDGHFLAPDSDKALVKGCLIDFSKLQALEVIEVEEEGGEGDEGQSTTREG